MGRFLDDTYGGITAFTAVIFLGMILSVGMAVDFMRHETYRAELQDAVDRGVLAAAAFGQSVDPKKTVEGYIKSTRFVDDGYTLNVVPDINAGTRTITATATYEVDTFFLKLAGIPTLDVMASGTAIEGATNIEVSMVLDISTSMVLTKTGPDSYVPSSKLQVLKTSAKRFIDLMFTDVNEDRLTLSLIPFAGQVNAGVSAASYFISSRMHNYSNCIEFNGSDFVYYPKTQFDTYQGADPASTTMLMPPKNSRAQMQHFNFSIYNNGLTNSYKPSNISGIDWGWCPSDTQAIEYFSDNPTRLKQRIDGLRTHEATGTQYGMKWAAMLLDPNSNGLTLELVSKGEVDSDYSALPRPYDYNAVKGVQKFIVVLSDGDTTGQERIEDPLYQTQSDYDHYATNLASNQNYEFMSVDTNRNKVSDSQSVSDARQTYRDLCDTAKENEVIIFAIGFEIAAGSVAEQDLQYCASTIGSYHRASSSDLENAFRDIAATIQKLKLLN